MQSPSRPLGHSRCTSELLPTSSVLKTKTNRGILACNLASCVGKSIEKSRMRRVGSSSRVHQALPSRSHTDLFDPISGLKVGNNHFGLPLSLWIITEFFSYLDTGGVLILLFISLYSKRLTLKYLFSHVEASTFPMTRCVFHNNWCPLLSGSFRHSSTISSDTPRSSPIKPVIVFISNISLVTMLLTVLYGISSCSNAVVSRL